MNAAQPSIEPKLVGVTQRLDLRKLLKELVADERLAKQEAEDIAVAFRSREDANLHPLEFIAKHEPHDLKNPGKHLTSYTLATWLAEKVNLPFYHIDPLKINVPSITQVMSYAFAQRHGILALEVHEKEVVIACNEPLINDWEANLQHVVQKKITRVICNPADLKRYIVEFYSLAKSVSRASEEGTAPLGITNLEQMLKLGQMKTPDANDQHIVSIVDWLLQYAFQQRASDIHLEPRREKGNVRFRIDGVMHQVYELPAMVMAAVTSRIKILGRMDVAEKRRPQDGRLKTVSPEGDEVELRLSTLPTAFGEKLVMRIFDPDVLLKTFQELGLSHDDYTRWNTMIHKPYGIILVTGPTGSGKTTTLYSTLKHLATPEVNVCTIEDPIEMIEPSFNQMQVQGNINLTFASGVRALLRQDPDIIMVGEIRDLETAEIAVQSALTGHLVVSTLHTNDSPSAVTRLLELGVPAYLIRATVLGIMAQRLVRTLCSHCKRPAPLDPEAWKELIHPWKATAPKNVSNPVGCLECRDTGYMGRSGIYEILPLTNEVKKLIREQTDIDALRLQGIKEGMHTLRISGAQKIASGLTTVEEVMRVTPTIAYD